MPGGVAISLGVDFFFCIYEEPLPRLSAKATMYGEDSKGLPMRRVFGVLALITVIGGVVFNASTVTRPKLFQEHLSDLLVSPQIPDVVISLACAFGVMVQLITGRLTDCLNLKLPFVFLTFCQAPLLLALAYGHDSTMVLFGVLFISTAFDQVTVNDAMVVRFVVSQ